MALKQAALDVEVHLPGQVVDDVGHALAGQGRPLALVDAVLVQRVELYTLPLSGLSSFIAVLAGLTPQLLSLYSALHFTPVPGLLPESAVGLGKITAQSFHMQARS